MKAYLSTAAIALFALLLSGGAIAQDKDPKEKSKNKLGDYDEIIIKKKDAGKDGKVTVEIKDGEVKVNGKPIDEFDDNNFSVRKKKATTYSLATPSPFRSFDDGNNFLIDNDRPFLGVTTDESDGGAKITSITKNSAAEKAGLMKGDIISKVNEEKVSDHADVSKAIGKLKAEDKVTITYKRDGKENKVTAVLGKRGGTTIFSPNHDFDFNFDHDRQLGQVFSYGGRPRIGIIKVEIKIMVRRKDCCSSSFP